MHEIEELKSHDSNKVKIFIGLLTALLIVFMFPKGESIESEVSLGSIWIQNDLIAQFSFPVIKDKRQYENEIKITESKVFPIYIKNLNAIKQISKSLTQYDNKLITIIDSSINNDTIFYNDINLTQSSFMAFKELRKNKSDFNNLLTEVNQAIKEIFRKGIVETNNSTTNKDSIAVRFKKYDRIVPLSNYFTIETARNYIVETFSNINFLDNVKNAILEYADLFIKPNYNYQSNLTNIEIRQAISNVSKYSDIVNENERIVAKHDRITKEVKAKIDSYKAAKGSKLGADEIFLQLLGKFLHIAFLLTLLIIYLYLFRKKIYYNNQKLFLISIIFILLSFITFLVNQLSMNVPIEYIIFIPTGAMLLTITFDSRVGFYSTVILTLVTGALRGNDYTFMASNLFAGGLAIYTVRDIKNRTQIFRSFQFILLAYVTTILAFGFERIADMQELFIEMSFAATNALISPVLTYGLLIFFERFFKVTTDLTLLELSNFDRPLLKELTTKTPGTFNHSMTIGTLVENAAEKIGANPLLARVGAYYHDIGKTLSPQSYVENQINNNNVHESISPEESTAIILKHIEEGKELAKENQLPQEIIDFIPMHHGTMVLSFFYEKAKKLYGEEKVNKDDYRYKGPKPQTKETAILMLADGCESAVRSMAEVEKEKVENLVDVLIQSRIDDQQLNESPLTFSDISKIKEAFKNVILGQYHKRIRYPKQDEMESGENIDK